MSSEKYTGVRSGRALWTKCSGHGNVSLRSFAVRPFFTDSPSYWIHHGVCMEAMLSASDWNSGGTIWVHSGGIQGSSNGKLWFRDYLPVWLTLSSSPFTVSDLHCCLKAFPIQFFFLYPSHSFSPIVFGVSIAFLGPASQRTGMNIL